MSLSFNEIPCSGRLSPLNTSNAECEDKKTGKKGIRTHNEISNFFLNLLSPLGIKKVVNVTDVATGKVIHLNRESLNKWLDRHHTDFYNLNSDEAYSKAIQHVRNNAQALLKQKQSDLLVATKEEVEKFKNENLINYKQCEVDGKKNETAALVDLTLSTPIKGYQPDPRAIGYAGLGHSLSQIQSNNKKIFGGAGMKIHISIDPSIPGNRVKALKALQPILTDPQKGVVQYKIYCGSTKEDLEKWFNDVPERPGGQQGKEITLYLVDEQQIQKAIDAGVPEKDIEMARKFIKTPEQIADLIKTCLTALREADVEGLGYLQNVSDKYLDENRSVGIRDDRKADGSLDDYAHVGEHAHGNYINGVPQWDDPSDKIKQLLE